MIQPRPVDLNTVVRNLERRLRRIIGEDVQLNLSLSPQLGMIRSDPGQLELVILNLAVNARDAMSEGGQLTLETADVELDEGYAREHVDVRPGSYVMLAVSDTGCGMDAEVQAHLFEPFFTTKDRGRGTGLGLATTYGIISQAGGHIRVYSEPRMGTTFKVFLPRIDEQPEPMPRTTAPPRPRGGNETILLVEDEDAVRSLACAALRREGYTVLDARSGDEALLLLEHHLERIDLLLTDVVMPGMSGRDLGHRLGQLLPGIRVLYMSGYTNIAMVHHGVLPPSTAFLQKPFTPDTLGRMVRQVLDGPPPSHPPDGEPIDSGGDRRSGSSR
jgi:CheY-like chemotaxis protein